MTFAAPGWRDTTPDHLAESAAIVAKMNGHGDVSWYQSPDGAAVLQVISIQESGSRGPVRALLGQFEDKLHRAFGGAMTDLRYVRTEGADGRTLVIDHVGTLNGTPLVMRRILGVDASGAVSTLSATCRGPEPTCAAGLLALQPDSTGFESLTASVSGSRLHRGSYEVGRVVGGVLGGLLVVMVIMRARRRRAAGQ